MRISHRLQQLRQEGRKALSVFITAGFPTIGGTVPLALALEKAGADLMELGVPFSDPIADGPTIQRSSEAALRNGVTLEKTLGFVREIRQRSEVPLVLMGYANPIYTYGQERLLDACSEAGVDGLIIADLPLEESAGYVASAAKREIATIFLAAPTTPAARLARLDEVSTGFLYCISITGVTGAQPSRAAETRDFLKLARATIRHNPFLVGFGISTPTEARLMAEMSDGVIIGSALIRTLEETSGGRTVEKGSEFVRSMRIALDRQS
jgi:tryptophan synthase alpha chain